MSVATINSASVTIFPAAKVEACLREELLHAIESEAAIKEIQLPDTAAARSAMSIQIDSLVVVELLCAVEPIVDFKLKDSVVRPGGYHSVNEAVVHLMPRIEKEWQKHTSKGHIK